jgi:hypothetical protein
MAAAWNLFPKVGPSSIPRTTPSILEPVLRIPRMTRYTEVYSSGGQEFFLGHVPIRNCLGEQMALYSGDASGCEQEKIFEKIAIST